MLGTESFATAGPRASGWREVGTGPEAGSRWWGVCLGDGLVLDLGGIRGKAKECAL